MTLFPTYHTPVSTSNGAYLLCAINLGGASVAPHSPDGQRFRQPYTDIQEPAEGLRTMRYATMTMRFRYDDFLQTPFMFVLVDNK